MTEKLTPDELPEINTPEDIIPSEDPAMEDLLLTEDEIPASEAELLTQLPILEDESLQELFLEDSTEDPVIFDGNFDPEAFLPDDPEEFAVDSGDDTPAIEELLPLAVADQIEEGPSAYMENYPKLPDSVEAPDEEKEPGFDDGGAFDQYFDQKSSGEKQSEKGKDRPTRKGRPRRPKGYGLLGIPHLLATVIWLMLIVAIGVSLGRMIWVCAADVLAFGREEKIVTISINKEDTIETITEKLHNAGLVRYPELFLLYADISDAEEKITTGSFTLNTLYDYHALVNQMSPRSGNRVIIEDVLIPEGYNCSQIFALLEEKGVCKAADLEEWAANGELGEYWFLEGVERGSKYCLEGFLFPDTYDFYENSNPKLVLEKMLNGFEYRFSEEVYAKLPALNERLSEMMRKNGKDEAYIAANQLDLRKLITVASLIEEETANAKESYKIASVIYNRLFNWGSNPPFLNIDAAIFYALGAHKSALTAEDLQVDSPYNTYRYAGLVPGPISNPGLDSISAALDPEDTAFYYYVLNPAAGEHDFSKTLQEHEKKVEKYLGGD